MGSQNWQSGHKSQSSIIIIIMPEYTSSLSSSYSTSRGYSSTSSYSSSYSSSGSRWVPAALGGSYSVETTYTPRAAEFLDRPTVSAGVRPSGRWYPMAMGK